MAPNEVITGGRLIAPLQINIQPNGVYSINFKKFILKNIYK